MAPERNKIVSADIIDGGLLLDFGEGRYAFYSADLLLSVFSQAEVITPDEDDHLPL